MRLSCAGVRRGRAGCRVPGWARSRPGPIPLAEPVERRSEGAVHGGCSRTCRGPGAAVELGTGWHPALPEASRPGVRGEGYAVQSALSLSGDGWRVGRSRHQPGGPPIRVDGPLAGRLLSGGPAERQYAGACRQPHAGRGARVRLPDARDLLLAVIYAMEEVLNAPRRCIRPLEVPDSATRTSPAWVQPSSSPTMRAPITVLGEPAAVDWRRLTGRAPGARRGRGRFTREGRGANVPRSAGGADLARNELRELSGPEIGQVVTTEPA
jgi:hypothetical protein